MTGAQANRSGGGIVVDGLVVCCRTLTPADLALLPRVVIEDDFVCEEGWTVPDVRWCGIRLTDVLATAQPHPTARYVRVCAGAYALPVPLSASQDALLCDEMNGRPVTRDDGGPWRLLWPGHACFTSVKHVGPLELTADAGPNDAERIARGRLDAGAVGQTVVEGALRSLARRTPPAR
jgi:DMSO/TMAO reductase YedYZ molybdopterin-dependent catalytic subunit